MHLVVFAIVGLLIGIVGHFVVPAASSLIATAIGGTAGGVIGGLIAEMFRKPAAAGKLHRAGVVGSVVGALLLVFLRALR